MFALVRRVALTVSLAMLVSGALMIALVRATEERAERVRLRGPQPAMRYVARTIADQPEAERERRVVELRAELGQELQLAREPADPAAHPRRSRPLEHWVEARGAGEPWMVFRLDSFSVLRVGPPARGPMGPPRGPGHGRSPVVDFVLFLVSVSAMTSVLVAVPFAKRLKAIEIGIDRLARGDFSRGQAPLEGGALGAITTALDRSAERLDRMFAERAELLQAVSHELGTPLSRVRFILALLERAGTEEERARRVRELEREVNELDALSSELVHYVEADAARLDASTIAVGKVVRALVDEERLASKREVETTVEIADDVELEANRRHFARALSNLVRNGLRYTRSKVTVTARDEGEFVVLAVNDDGRGIPEEARERVLQPFVRLEASRTRSGGGAGLGLAIVRRIVERHGGTLSIEQSPLGGAALISKWPKRAQRAEGARDAHDSPSANGVGEGRSGTGSSREEVRS
jgi:signal transduction histidine kinase